MHFQNVAAVVRCC